ncbi:MAG: diaminopimelate epimerase [Desulfofustis sp.]|jgi:diaminopimelate epimerase
MKLDFPITITKMSGAGNDFIVIDHRSGFIPEPYQPQFAQLVCRHSFSVGADGLILIEEHGSEDFSWRFYNKDGSVAEMCGNGARCAARFAWRKGIAGRRMRFATLAGVIEAELIGEQEHVRVTMTDPSDYQDSLLITLGGSEKEVFFINTGVPHAVVFVDSENPPVEHWGRTLRYHEQFEPAGTNANFVKILEDDELLVRTYERGVEAETMACGTGVVAAAIVAARQGLVESPVDVTTTGGEQLVVQFTLGESTVDDVHLQGPARIIYEAELSAEALL